MYVFISAKTVTYEHSLLYIRYVVDRHPCHMTVNFGVFVDDGRGKLPTLYRNRESLAQFDNLIKHWVYVRRITRTTMYEKAPFC